MSSLAKKYTMGLTGILLVLFLVGHLCGNLLIFVGQDALNAYAETLQSLGELIWVARITLLVAVGLHIWTAIALLHENRKARPIAYANQQHIETTLAARTMALSGGVVLAFIIYHLLHFTLQTVHPEFAHLHDAMGRHDVYSMVILGFRQPLEAGAYIVAIALLCAHLSHGIWSVFQTLGLTTDATLAKVKLGGRALALIFFVGFCSIPMAVLLGILKLPGGVQ